MYLSLNIMTSIHVTHLIVVVYYYLLQTVKVCGVWVYVSIIGVVHIHSFDNFGYRSFVYVLFAWAGMQIYT